MKRILILCLLATSFLLVSPILIKAQNTETVTISTYYPSPMGVYKNLRLFPISAAQAPLCDAVHKDNEGIMYYNNDAGQNQLMVCRETAPGVFGWQAVGASFWTQADNNLYPVDTNWNVGIGTNDPKAKLDVAGEVKVGNTSLACGVTTAGAMRYNNGVEYCNGSTWVALVSGVETGHIYLPGNTAGSVQVPGSWSDANDRRWTQTVNVTFTPKAAMCAAEMIGRFGTWAHWHCNTASINAAAKTVSFYIDCDAGLNNLWNGEDASCANSVGVFNYMITGN